MGTVFAELSSWTALTWHIGKNQNVSTKKLQANILECYFEDFKS